MEFPLLAVVFIIFVLMIVCYSIKSLDFVAISLLLMFISATITGLVLGLEFEEFMMFIQWRAIIIIFSMSIITKIAADSNILEFIAVKLFRVSKGNQRTFFWLLCTITTLLAAIISDVVVVLIFIPITIRMCKFLKIKPGTYMLGVTISINIGSILTPFSSGENIIISTAFGLNTLYFVQYFWILAFVLLFLTIFLMDRLILSKEPKIDEQQKKYVLELIDTDTMIKNKKMFYFNSIAIIITVVLFVILPLLYLTAIISALLLVIINKKFTKKEMSSLLKNIEWDIIFFFIALYIVIGCLLKAGFQDLIKIIPFENFDTFLLCLFILLIVSLLSGAVANTPTALIFIPIVATLIELGYPPVPLIFALIFGVNLGGNFLPQGAACDTMTLKIAQESGVENFNYMRLLKTGASFAIMHLLVSIGFLYILVLFFG